jgi:hypothetical protein
MAAVTLNDMKLCGSIIRNAGERHWREPDGYVSESARPLVPGAHILDMYAAPKDLVQKLPIHIVGALFRASIQRTGLPERHEEDNEAMYAEFMRLIESKGMYIPVGRRLMTRRES